MIIIKKLLSLLKKECVTTDSNGDLGVRCIEDNTPHAESTVLFKDEV